MRRLWGKGNWKRRYLPCSKVFNICNYWSSNGKAINPFQLILSVNVKKFIEKQKSKFLEFFQFNSNMAMDISLKNPRAHILKVILEYIEVELHLTMKQTV